MADSTRIKYITQAKSSIVLIEIRIHQCLDLRVAEICPSHSPITAARWPLVWWSLLSCIWGKSLSSPRSALSIGILSVVTPPVATSVSAPVYWGIPGLPPGPPGTDYFGLPFGWGGLCVAICQGSLPVRRESRNGRCSKYQLDTIVETTYLAL